MLGHFLGIWVRPRETVREALDTDSSTRVYFLASCFGIVGFLDRSMEDNFGDTLPLHWILALVLAAGPLAGILALNLFSFLLRWTGKLVKGHATLGELRTALAYSWIPILWFLPLHFVAIALYGQDAFVSNQNGLGPYPFLTGLMVGLFPIWMLLGVWIGVIGLRCLAEAQGFSFWRALVNSLLALAVLVVAVVAVTIAVVSLIPSFS